MALGCGEPTERWEFQLTAFCDGADVSTNIPLCFNAGKDLPQVQGTCNDLCTQTGSCGTWTCQCAATKGTGPCSCSDATRSLQNGC